MKWLFVVCSMIGPVLACQVVEGDYILAKDLAAANPVFSTVEPAMPIGPAPMAGVRRVLHGEALLRLTRENGMALPLAPMGEVCFERATEPLTEEKLQPVLDRSLGIEGARIEILDYSRYGVPRGALEFARTGLSAAGMWHGHVAYTEGRTAPVWARVRITTEQTWVEALKPLAAARSIDPDQLVLRKGPRFPFGPAALDSVDLVAGKAPLRAIQPGAPILASMLTTVREVERGDKVAVEVSIGTARLSFQATAESPGRAGDSILIRNPENGRLFPARIQSRGKVAVKL